jgi:preprotein translocase subunit SecD
MHQLAQWKILLVTIICGYSIWMALPNYYNKGDIPGWLPQEQVPLGLDLQGGASLLLEVDLNNIEQEYMSSFQEEVRKHLREARIAYGTIGVSGKTLRFTLRDPSQAQQAYDAARKAAAGTTKVSTSDTGIEIVVGDEVFEQRKKSAMQQSIEIINRRIDEMGTKEPSIQQQGDTQILVQLPGVSDPQEAKALLGKTAKLTFRLVHPENVNIESLRIPPMGTEILSTDERTERGRTKYLIERTVRVSGEMLVDAQQSYDQNGQPAVSFSLDAVGAKRFSDVTRNNVGRQMAIILDNKVISAPVLQSHIPGGSSIITGAFTIKDTQNLAVLLRAGALPAPLTVLEERVVGPDLGADSIAAGKYATIIAVLAVVVFMVLFYGILFGTIANLALMMNLVMLFASLNLMQATLTLPGIAGIALTLGMAVDANILIFERIREELRAKQSSLNAINSGFTRAMATIVDSNITTIIGAVLLYQFGTGAVRGFAVTLIVGIVISMFTAVTLTRLLILGWHNKFGHSDLPL